MSSIGRWKSAVFPLSREVRWPSREVRWSSSTSALFPLSREVRWSSRGVRWSSSNSARMELRSGLGRELEMIKEAGTFKRERVILGRQQMTIRVEGCDKALLNFCANNYLGLSSHESLIETGRQSLLTHGAGVSSVRFICGTQDIHRTLESRIAKFHDREDAIIYPSCFDANAGLFEAILGPEDTVISDELNHASIIDGIRLCKAQRLRYRHLDMTDLEAQLKLAKDSRRRLIATDGAFSMDGDVAPLKEILDLADKYNAIVFVDDCHATGFLGKTGRGTEELLGVSGRVEVINSTLGKALGGSMGGYTVGSKEVVDILRQRSRPYLFSNSLAPVVTAMAIKVFDMLTENNTFAQSLNANVNRFRSAMHNAGFKLSGNKAHPICPVMLGDARLASEFADRMLAEGIYVIGFSYPVVPKGKARIRVQISAAHTADQIDSAVACFSHVGKQLGVLGQ